MLDSLGQVYFSLTKYEKAIQCYEQALAILGKVKNREQEGETLKNSMLLWKKISRPRMAIFYGKQTVNAYQEIRGNIKNLEKESQQSYLASVEDGYRTLADLLISEGRLPEAEQVLNLLKAEEYSLITRRDGPKTDGLGFDKAEAGALEVYDHLAALGAERGQLLGRLKQAALSETEKTQLNTQVNTVEAKMRETNGLIRNVLSEIEKQNPDVTALDKTTQAFMRDLKDLGQGTVALYTLVSKEKGWIILVTPDFRKAYTVDVNGLENAAVQFRDALKTDRYDPLRPAQKLYRMLMVAPQHQKNATLADDLKSYGAKTLLWSLDGVLRYVPIAALHDGEKYMAERYSNVVFTTESLPRLKDAMSPDWKD